MDTMTGNRASFSTPMTPQTPDMTPEAPVPTPPKTRRFLIIGAGGSGKSTLAKAVAARAGIPYHDTDAMYWRADWSLASDAEVVASLPLDQPRWVLDGNFVADHATIHGRDCQIGIGISKLLAKNAHECLRRWRRWRREQLNQSEELIGIRESCRAYGYGAHVIKLALREQAL